MNENDIFMAATQIDDPQLRDMFLDSACGADSHLRAGVEKLLKRYSAWGAGLDQFSREIPSKLAEIRTQERAIRSGLLSPAEIFPAGFHFRHFRVLRRLGVGGMGEVYLAMDEKLERKVALKVLPLEYAEDADWIGRFESEARAVSALNHPNVLTIYEIGNDNQLCYMVTEFIEGHTLRQLIDQHELDLNSAIQITMDLAKGLAVAHAAGIIHRDLKPENVMVREDRLVKILDFGLAKHPQMPVLDQGHAGTSHQATEPGMLLGTVRYMSPEQICRLSLDWRTDIFSLGVILYELIVGQHPFPGAHDAAIMSSILQAAPQQIDTIDSPELRRLVESMLQKDHHQRLITAREVVSCLKQIRKSMRTKVAPGRLVRSDGNVGEAEVPEVFYARSGDVNIAYQVLGQGSIDIVFVMGWVSHLDWFWKEPDFARFLKQLAAFSRLILFDKRGTGLSDKVPTEHLPNLEQRMDDVRAVMQAVGSERAVLCGVSEGGPMCSLFAATYPEKTVALIMIGSYARRIRADDYPWGPTSAQHAEFLEAIAQQWGGPVGIEARAPSKANDAAFRKWWATYLRMGASPGAVLALTRMNSQIDIRPILRMIQVPTLVIHRRGDQCLLVDEGRYLAENIPGATFIELPGNDHLPFVGDQEEITSSIASFLETVSHGRRAERILATVLLAEFTTSKDPAVQHRINAAWTRASRELQSFRGLDYSHCLGSNLQILGSFDGPARAIRAAQAIHSSTSRLGVALRIVLHTGECDQREEILDGPALQTVRELLNQLESERIVVTSTTKDLVAGAEFDFQPIDHCVCTVEQRLKLFVLQDVQFN